MSNLMRPSGSDDDTASSTEDARRKAEYHREQIADTLDQLGNRIGDTVQSAKDQINKPINLIRKHPFAALAVSVVAGVAVAAVVSQRNRNKRTWAQELAQAYYDGRHDEQEARPPRQLPRGNPHVAERSPLAFRSILLDLAFPVIRTLSGNMAELLVARKFKR